MKINDTPEETPKPLGINIEEKVGTEDGLVGGRPPSPPSD